MSNRHHQTHSLAHRETGHKRSSRSDNFVHGRKRRKMDVQMGVSKSSSTNTDRGDGNQDVAFMIPGVDGKLQFGFPTKIITILRYFDYIPSTSTTGGVTTTVFRMNGPRDPDVTNIGHQPLYWDRYSAIYTGYRVLGSRLTAEINGNNTAATQGPWAFGINGSTSSATLGTSVRNRMEQNDAVNTVYNWQDGTAQLFLTYAPESKLGRPAGDDTVGGLVGNDPSAQYYAHVWFADLNGTTSTAYIKVGIEYTIEFYGLIQEPEN